MFTDLNEIVFKKRTFNDPCVYNEYLKQLGWDKKSQPREHIYDGDYLDSYKKYTVYEFIYELNHTEHVNWVKHLIGTNLVLIEGE